LPPDPQRAARRLVKLVFHLKREFPAA
jgi:hypothetical protein